MGIINWLKAFKNQANLMQTNEVQVYCFLVLLVMRNLYYKIFLQKR